MVVIVATPSALKLRSGRRVGYDTLSPHEYNPLLKLINNLMTPYSKTYADYRKEQKRADIKEWAKDIAGGFVVLLTIIIFTLTVLILSK